MKTLLCEHCLSWYRKWVRPGKSDCRTCWLF